MLQAILIKSWRQHPTKHQLYGHLPLITKTIKARWTRQAGHCWRSRDELISDVLLWTPSYGRAKAGWPAQSYIQQLCEDMGCSPEDLPEAMNDRGEWRERVRDIRAGGMTWWFICYNSLGIFLQLKKILKKWKRNFFFTQNIYSINTVPIYRPRPNSVTPLKVPKDILYLLAYKRYMILKKKKKKKKRKYLGHYYFTVHLTWIVFMIGGRWLYSWCLVGCCCQDLFKIACSILV